MKLNTHDRTPRPKNSNLIKGLFLFCWLLIFSMFCLLAFACLYYARSIVGGISAILIPILMTAIILTHIKDMEKAYIEVIDDEIYVVDYYWGIKKTGEGKTQIGLSHAGRSQYYYQIILCHNRDMDLFNTDRLMNPV